MPGRCRRRFQARPAFRNPAGAVEQLLEHAAALQAAAGVAGASPEAAQEFVELAGDFVETSIGAIDSPACSRDAADQARPMLLRYANIYMRAVVDG